MLNHESFIICLEGLDASGKTTVTNEIHKLLINKIKNIYYKTNHITEINSISFPNYRGVAGQAIKTLLNKELDIDLRKVLTSLFALDRQTYNYGEDHSQKVMIFNRYYGSNFCYNLDLGLDWLISLEEKSYLSDITFILDIDPNESFKRRGNRRDEYEKSLQFLIRARQNYLNLAKKFGWVVLDGTKNTGKLVDEVFQYITQMNHGLTYRDII